MLLYFARTADSSEEITANLSLITNNGTAIGGEEESIDGVISTHRGNAGSWSLMIGESPVGEWQLALPNTVEMKNRFKNEKIEDILFVITYSGRTPAWPD